MQRSVAMAAALVAAGLGMACNGPLLPAPVTVAAVTPDTGPLAGGTAVTIIGSGFTDVTSVTIGGSELDDRSVESASRITGTTPATTTPGPADVVVTTRNYGDATCEACYTYVRAPLLAAQQLTSNGDWDLVFVDPASAYSDGWPASTAFNEADPGWSPDGESVAFASDRLGSPDIFVARDDGAELRRVTDRPGRERYPSWSPDGQWIVFMADTESDSSYDIWRVRLDGTDLENLTETPDMTESWPAASPDGTRIAYARQGHVYLLNVADRTTIQFPSPPNSPGEIQLAWSPVGGRVAILAWPIFPRSCCDTRDVWIAAADGTDAVLIRTGVISRVTWSPDGQELALSYSANESFGRFGTTSIGIVRLDGTSFTSIWSGNLLDLGGAQAWRAGDLSVGPSTRVSRGRAAGRDGRVGRP